MLVNNFDRTPLVWSHEGNANNVILRRGADGVTAFVAIDQAPTAIVVQGGDDELAAAYVGRVREALGEAVAGQASGPYVTKVREFIQRWTGVDIGEPGCAALQKGMVAGAVKLVLLDGCGRFHARTSEAFAAAGWGEQGVQSISLHFIERVAGAMAEVVRTPDAAPAEDFTDVAAPAPAPAPAAADDAGKGCCSIG